MTAVLVPVGNPTDLDVLTPSAREMAVSRYLTDARDRLALAVEATGPEAVAAIKAEIATMAEATKQLGLSKEIQEDATEMVRRAEYALRRAHLSAQQSGAMPNRGGWVDGHRDEMSTTSGDLYASDSQRSQIAQMTDGVSEDEFEEAVAEARAEGNLSRANVGRKARGFVADKLSGEKRLDRISELADKGHSSDQIARELGHTEEYIRQLARENDIQIPADRMLRGSRRRIDHTRAVESTVMTLDGLATGINIINLAEVDPSQAAAWATSLTDSLRVLNRFHKQIKEMAQ